MLHPVPAHPGFLRQFAAVRQGKIASIEVARTTRFQPGTPEVFDRSYRYFEWWMELTWPGAFLLRRFKDNAQKRGSSSGVARSGGTSSCGARR